MIRNPLERRMFMNPQQRRGMARMPQGILASGPRIMNAAMSQNLGGVVPTGDMPGAEDIPSFLPGDVNFAALNPAPGVSLVRTGLRGDRARRRDADDSVVEVPELPPVSDDNTDAEGRTRRAPKAKPKPNEESEFKVLGPEDGGTQGGSTTPPATGGTGDSPPKSDDGSYFDDLGGNQQEESSDAYKQLLNMLNAQMPEGKSTETYIDEATDLLKKYGIEAGDKDEMQRLRVMEFFLNMAAGKSPDFLENVADAGKETFKGYAKDIRDLNARDQELKLAGITMGLSEKGKADATRQAINLKKIEVVGDATKELLSLADKSKQVDYLVRVGNMTQKDATALVYGGDDRKLAYELEYAGLLAGKVSPFLATQMAGNSIDLTEVNKDTNAALNALQGILASGPPGDADLALLGLLTGQGRVQAKQAIIDAGYEDEANTLLP